MSTIEHDALVAISKSSSSEFKTSLEWGQWCRKVARAAIDEDKEMLSELIEDGEVVS